MKNLVRNHETKVTTNKILIFLTAPLFLFGGLLALWFFLLMIGLIMKIVFGQGNLITENDEVIWQWEIHFFPYGLLVSLGTALIIWIASKRLYKR